MEIKCISNKNPLTDKIYQPVQVGKSYKFMENVVGGQVRIYNDEAQPLNYPVKCFDMEAVKKKCREFPLCSTCGNKFIGKMEDEICKHCLRKQV